MPTTNGSYVSEEKTFYYYLFYFNYAESRLFVFIFVCVVVTFMYLRDCRIYCDLPAKVG